MSHYHLYVLMDIFSRYVEGWLVADRESTALAKCLIAESAAKQGIEPNQLTVHSDRGPVMTSLPLAQMMADLGITKSHSRPYTSNDNPFSEALFKTAKYRPEFPDRFESAAQALHFGRVLFPWSNNDHHHSGLGFLTPHAVHYGDAPQILATRAVALAQAFARTPHRFKGRPPSPPTLPSAVYINPPTATQQAVAEQRGGNSSPTSDDQPVVDGEHGSPRLAAGH